MGAIKRYSIKEPTWLQVKKDGKFSYGYNQEWYSDDWKQLAGCGPTTATQLISYIRFKEGLEDVSHAGDGELALQRMEEVWNYVKPRFGGGLYKTHWMSRGLDAYMKDAQMPFQAEMLPIYPLRGNHYDLATVVEFIKKGLEADSPIAFLNRHRGKEEGLSTWHWVPIISMEVSSGDVRCKVYDEEIERVFSLKRWLKDNLLGGGFAYLVKQ